MRTVEIITNVILVLMLISHFMSAVDSVQALSGARRIKHVLNDAAPGSSMPIGPLIPILPETTTSMVLHLLMNVAIFGVIAYLLMRRSKMKGMPSYTLTTIILAFSMIMYAMLSIYMMSSTFNSWDKSDAGERGSQIGVTSVFATMFAGFLALVIVRSR